MSQGAHSTNPHAAIDAVWRIESPRLIAGLIAHHARCRRRRRSRARRARRRARTVAARRRPVESRRLADGRAKHRAIDLSAAARCWIASTTNSAASSKRSRKISVPDYASALDDDIGDDLLRLIFTSCHPVLSHRCATRAHSAPDRRPHHRRNCARISGSRSSIAQRIVRAKRTLADAHVPFEVPRGAELSERLANVLK